MGLSGGSGTGSQTGRSGIGDFFSRHIVNFAFGERMGHLRDLVPPVLMPLAGFPADCGVCLRLRSQNQQVRGQTPAIVSVTLSEGWSRAVGEAHWARVDVSGGEKIFHSHPDNSRAMLERCWQFPGQPDKIQGEASACLRSILKIPLRLLHRPA
jgi:hypothetical protein